MIALICAVLAILTLMIVMIVSLHGLFFTIGVYVMVGSAVFAAAAALAICAEHLRRPK